MKYLAIIPARYASTRFPAKPLAFLEGKTVIQRVYNQVYHLVDKTVVATDNTLIAEEVTRFGGEVVLTSENHKSGTDRCCEAFNKVGDGYDIVINVQGDEPFIQMSQIMTIKECFNDEGTDIATLVKPFSIDDGFEAVKNPNSPKVVFNKKMEAMYFSRSVIPFIRGVDFGEEWMIHHTFYKHIGIYAYRSNVLKIITQLPQSSLELSESLEQLRWIQNGFKIKVGLTDVETIGIDTPQDLNKAVEFLHKHPELI